MIVKFKWIFAWMILVVADNVNTQDLLLLCSDSTYCVPSLEGMPRSKGIEVSYESIFEQNVTTDSNYDENESKTKFERSTRLSAKITIPIVNKSNVKMAFGLRYFEQAFQLEEDVNPTDFYKQLESTTLKSFSGTYYFLKPLLGNKYLIFRAKLAGNGDYEKLNSFDKRYMHFSFNALYGVKKSFNTILGFGVSFSNNFGKTSILPLFLWNHSFTSNKGIEILLPVMVRFRWTSFDEKNFIFTGIKGSGSNFNTQFAELIEGQEHLFIRKMDVYLDFTYEREIHDWLWFGVSTGAVLPFYFDISDKNNFSGDVFVDSDLAIAPFFKLSLFVVKPRNHQ